MDAEADAAGRGSVDGDCRQHHPRSPAGTGRSARARRHPPRSQAREHRPARRAERQGSAPQDSRLRHRPRRRWIGNRVYQPRHARIHVARTADGAGSCAGFGGLLFAVGDVLRTAYRSCSQGPLATAERRTQRCSARHRQGHRARPLERPAPAPAERASLSRRSRGCARRSGRRSATRTSAKPGPRAETHARSLATAEAATRAFGRQPLHGILQEHDAHEDRRHRCRRPPDHGRLGLVGSGEGRRRRAGNQHRQQRQRQSGRQPEQQPEQQPGQRQYGQ